MANNFAYMRISTKEERGLQKFNRQEKALQKYAKDCNIEFLMMFKEDESGKSFSNRKEFQKLEAIVQPGDTIFFKDVSRFTREAENGYEKYMEFMRNDVNLVFLDNPTLSTDYIKSMSGIATGMGFTGKVINDFIIKILLATELDRVEQERLTLSKRIRDGIAASPNHQGRAAGSLDKMTDELKADLLAYHERIMTGVAVMKKHSISRNTMKKYLSILLEERRKAERKHDNVLERLLSELSGMTEQEVLDAANSGSLDELVKGTGIQTAELVTEYLERLELKRRYDKAE